jgi:competence protein ComEA
VKEEAGMDATAKTNSPPTPAAITGIGGGRASAPAGLGPAHAVSSRASRFIAGIRESVWTPVAVKTGAILAGMLVLAAIGAASTLAGAGVPVSAAPSASVRPGGVWVAPDHADPHAATSSDVSPTAIGANGTPNSPTPLPAADGTTASTSSPGVTPDGKIILNTATEEELTKLPRVGAKRAQAIVLLRQKLGHFRQATDLLRVRGIGRKTLRQMMPRFVLDMPGAAR